MRGSPLPRVALVTTGGTIQMEGRDRLDLAHYGQEVRAVDGARLLEGARETQTLASVEVIDFGWHRSVDPAAWPELTRLVSQLVEKDGFHGVVVTHGTNTLEETAYFLHLTVRSRRPVVVTGAMRPPSAASSDADLNLINAVRTAASDSVAGLGVVVLLNDTIHSARDVTKTATYRLQAFESPDYGPLGYADADGRIVITRAPTPRHTTTSMFSADLGALPRVDIAVSYPGQDEAMIDAAVAAGAEGIVLAGTGAGGRTEREDAALSRALARGVAVVLSSRTGSGRVVPNAILRSQGMIGAGELGPWKARVLLMLALTRTREPKLLQEIFDRY